VREKYNVIIFKIHYESILFFELIHIFEYDTKFYCNMNNSKSDNVNITLHLKLNYNLEKLRLR
jgi:hypothetical protein